MNRYAYVVNDPIGLIDPLGLDCQWVWFDGGVQVICDPLDQGGGGPGGPIRHAPLLDDPPDIGRGPGQGPGLLPVGPPPPPIDPIWDALKRLRDLLAKDPDCLAFLNSASIDALGRLDTIMDGYYGQAGMLPKKNDNGIWSVTNAVSFGYPGQLVTVNTVGAFYAGKLGNLTNTTDRGRIPGGTPAAQGFILLHELGHNTNVLQHDLDKQSIGDANNLQLEKHCSKTIKALSD